MASRRKAEQSSPRRGRPATTPEAREHELISLAEDLAEKQIRGGTASSQVVTHFLKLGSTRERLEQQKIEHENELLAARKEQIAGAARIEELYLGAIAAMRRYAGDELPQDEDDAA